MAQECDFPIILIRADWVDNTKPSSWVFGQILSNTAVSGYWDNLATAREALVAKLAANIESSYKSATANPSVYPTYRTTLAAAGGVSDVLWTGLTAGTAAESVTISYTAATASTTATVAACTANSAGTAVVVTLAVSGGNITATANAVIAAVAADTGAGAHAANFLVGTAVPVELAGAGTGVVTNMAAQTIKQANTIGSRNVHERVVNALLGFGKGHI